MEDDHIHFNLSLEFLRADESQGAHLEVSRNTHESPKAGVGEGFNGCMMLATSVSHPQR
jgi:hypothetical protein